MDMVLTLAKQVVVMFILAGVGFVMFKTNKITKEGSKSLGNILIYLSLPCVIINSFQVERTSQALWGLLLSAAAAFVVLVLSILISRLIFKKDAIAVFASSFSNPGFFGIPLILSSLAPGAVFYVAPFVAFVNLFQWTIGVAIMTGEKKGLKLTSVLKAPFMIAIFIGLFFFLTGLKIPSLAGNVLTFVANVNTPLAMFTVGIYLAQTDLVKMVKKGKLYGITAVRMLLIPAVSLAALSIVPSGFLDMKLAILIAASCPVGSNVAVYAQLHQKDYTYAVETVVISTLISLITIPAWIGIAQWLW